MTCEASFKLIGGRCSWPGVLSQHRQRGTFIGEGMNQALRNKLSRRQNAGGSIGLDTLFQSVTKKRLRLVVFGPAMHTVPRVYVCVQCTVV